MYPLEEKVNETYNGGATLPGNLPVREHRRHTPRFLLAMRSMFVVAAVIVVFNRIRTMEPFVEMESHQKSFSSKPDYNTAEFWNTVRDTYAHGRKVPISDVYDRTDPN